MNPVIAYLGRNVRVTPDTAAELVASGLAVLVEGTLGEWPPPKAVPGAVVPTEKSLPGTATPAEPVAADPAAPASALPKHTTTGKPAKRGRKG